jgi:pSer/pThr/pTyr-binding forkhead associated (FHA) protein
MALLRDMTNGREIPLTAATTIIGRDPTCDIRVREGQVSRRHAQIVRDGADYFLEDMGSANGTFLNGERIVDRVRLQVNDTLEVPGLTVTFEDESASKPPGREAKSGPRPLLEQSRITTSFDVRGGFRVEVAPEAKLRAVLEISRNLSGTLNLEAVLPKILESLFNVFPQADRGFILLLDPSTGQLEPRAIRRRHASKDESLPLSHTIVDQAMKTGQAILSADAGLDARFGLSQSIRQLELRTVMCVPLLSQQNLPLGVIQIDGQDPRRMFNEEDLDVLLCASTQAARAVELAQLHEARRDLEAATEIQKSFLPREAPKSAGLRFFHHYSPAQQIGGDYFDYIPLPNNRLAVTLGDVSGKGVAAALLMAQLSAFTRFSFAGESHVGNALSELNRFLTRTFADDRFVTFVAAVIDLTTWAATLVNAGHPPLLRRRGSQVEELGATIGGLPLGMFDMPYDDMTVELAPGDVLLLYTDGVTEARSSRNEIYGMDRLKSLVAACEPNVAKLGATILADVRKFAEGRPPSDDLTLVGVERIR